MITPEQLSAAHPEWSVIPLEQAKGAKKPTEKAFPDQKTLWSGGPWGGIISTQPIDMGVEMPMMSYSWKYVRGKTAVGFYGVGRYLPSKIVEVLKEDHNGVVLSRGKRPSIWTWHFDGDTVATRVLDPLMIPPKKPKAEKPTQDSSGEPTAE